MVTTARTAATLARVARHPIAMQIGAVGVEPGLGARDVRADALDHAPERLAVVHFDEMSDLVRREIVEHEGRREDQPPRIRQHAGGRARAPATRRIANRHPLDRDTERIGCAPAGGFQIAFDFALEKIGNPARDMRCLTGDAEQALIASAALDPYRAAMLPPMRDSVFDARSGITAPCAKGAG